MTTKIGVAAYIDKTAVLRYVRQIGRGVGDLGEWTVQEADELRRFVEAVELFHECCDAVGKAPPGVLAEKCLDDRHRRQLNEALRGMSDESGL